MSIGWYINGNARDGYKFSDVYDFAGFTYVVNCAGTGKTIYYDPNYMVIVDTDGDGDMSDEAGYDEFNQIAGEKFPKKKVLLEADIDLNGKDWLPIGVSSSFQGYFEGQGHTVSNFTVSPAKAAHTSTSTGQYYSLFGVIAHGAEIRELTVTDATFRVDNLESHLAAPTYVSVFGAQVGHCVISDCNAYNISAELVNTGTGTVMVGYMAANMDTATSSIENCSVYQFTLKDNGIEYKQHELKFVGSFGASVTDPASRVVGCEVLTSDPLA